MRKPAVVAAVISVLALACGGAAEKITPGAKDTTPIRIGVVGPMTGLAGFVGKNMVEGIQLAVEDLNSKGGVLGRHVEYVTRDDEGDPAKTTTAVRELVEKEHVSALFGPAGTTNYLAMSRIIEDNQVPAWVIMSGRELTDDVNPYAFRAYIPDAPEITALTKFAAARYSHIAILTGDDQEGKEFAASTTKALAAAGKPPVAVVSFAQDETDFSPIALKVKKAGADAVILGTHLGLFASRFAVAAKNLGLDAKLMGLAGLINYTYPDLARSAADGTVVVSFRSWGHLPRSQWPRSVLSFYNAYVKRFLPDGEYSQTGAYRAYSTNFLTYDMVQIWAAAATKAGTPVPSRVDAVLNDDFTYPASRSVIGVSWHYSKTDHDGIRPGDLYFYTWDLGANGKFKLSFHGTVTDVVGGKSDL